MSLEFTKRMLNTVNGGVIIGFSMIFAVLLGVVISLILQLPKLLRRNSKVLNAKEDENT